MAHVSEHGGRDATNLINPIDGFETLLRVLGRWADRRGYLVYKAEEDGAGGLMKFPVDPETGLMTAPNKTEDRAVLTLVDAIGAATDLLAKGEGFFGVGMATERVGLVAVDLDSCLIRNGVVKLNAETMKLLGGSLESYTEVSPSGGGARMLIDGLPAFATGMATGAEVCGVGLYYTSKKFVTLTGLPLAGSPAEIRQADQTVAQIANHIAKYRTAEVLDGWSRSDMSMKQAEAAIVEGSSLHDATMAWLTRAWNRLDMTEQEVGEGVYALYDRSAAKTATPARWGQRRRGIARQLDWVRKTFGRRAQKIEDLPTQVVEAARRHIMEKRQSPAPAAEPEPEVASDFDVDDIGEGPWVLRAPFGVKLAITSDEAKLLQAYYDKPWDQVGKEGVALVHEMRRSDEVCGGDSMEEAAAEYAKGGGVNDPDRHRWMLSMPSVAGERLARYLHQAQAFDMPGSAALGAIMALSTLAANRYFVDWRYKTGLQLYGAVTARTGAGKQAILDLLQGAAGIAEAVCIDRASSGPALRRAMGEGAVTMLSDEWSQSLEAARRSGSSHMTEMNKVVLEAHGKALGLMGTQVYASARNNMEAVPFPHLTALYTSTGEALNEVLDVSMVGNGMLNRMVVIDAQAASGGRWPITHRQPDLAEALDDVAASFSVGSTIARPADQKRTFRHRVQGEEGAEVVERSLTRIILPQAFWQPLRDATEALEAGLGDLYELAGRFEYNVVVIAGLLRVGDYVHGIDDATEELVITQAQFDYAIKLVQQSVDELADRFRHRVTEGDTDRTLNRVRDKIISILDESGRGAAERKVSRWLDRKLVPLALIVRYLRAVDPMRHNAYIAAMQAREWISENVSDEYQKDSSGVRVPAVMFRVQEGLFGG